MLLLLQGRPGAPLSRHHPGWRSVYNGTLNGGCPRNLQPSGGAIRLRFSPHQSPAVAHGAGADRCREPLASRQRLRTRLHRIAPDQQVGRRSGNTKSISSNRRFCMAFSLASASSY
jgi:hypothetical protein